MIFFKMAVYNIIIAVYFIDVSLFILSLIMLTVQYV
jgi:hypothetical protein